MDLGTYSVDVGAAVNLIEKNSGLKDGNTSNSKNHNEIQGPKSQLNDLKLTQGQIKKKAEKKKAERKKAERKKAEKKTKDKLVPHTPKTRKVTESPRRNKTKLKEKPIVIAMFIPGAVNGEYPCCYCKNTYKTTRGIQKHMIVCTRNYVANKIQSDIKK